MMLGQYTAYATEFGSSFYFPGISETFTPGIAPPPGVVVVDEMLFQSGKADIAVHNGRIENNIRMDAFINVFGVTDTMKTKALGADAVQVGFFLPVGNVSVKSSVNTPFGSRDFSDSTLSVGDSIIASSLFWNKGNMHYKVTESIYTPTGEYTLHNVSNVGKNHWGFDTTFAMTHLNVKSGLEVSLAPGVLFNTTNTATDYRSGTELHVEFAVNKHYLKKHYAVGIQGYYYRQLTGDSGSGAKLGDFKGEAMGIGPAFLYTPPAAKGRVNIVAKCLFDLEHKNRMHGNYEQIVATYKF
jgi:hypothetical protein